ncbi:MAG: hypothetical protein AB2784_01800, partial [Candidatus Thiodiazotropha endolucinida]
SYKTDLELLDCFGRKKLRLITEEIRYLGYGYVPLRFGGNAVRRMGTQQQQQQRIAKPKPVVRSR